MFDENFDHRIKWFTDRAREKLEAEVKDFGVHLIKECEHFTSNFGSSGEPEITEAIVEDASSQVMRNLRYGNGVKRAHVVWRVMSYLWPIVIGILFTVFPEGEWKTFHWVVSAICTIGCLTTIVMVEFPKRGN